MWHSPEGNSLFISDTANNCVRNLTAGQAVPGPPGSVTATSGNGSATVSWRPPVNPGGLPVSGYVVATVGGTATVDVGGGSTSAVVTGLTNGDSLRLHGDRTEHAGVGSGVGGLEQREGPAMTTTPTLKTAYRKQGAANRTGRRPNLVALGLIPLLVLVACISTSATAATSGQTESGFSAPRSGYLVYWDQDEEVDYYESANHSQGQLMAPWDLNGQVCPLNDGTGRWVGGSDPTNESQHNPGGPPTYPFKQPAISEEMNDVNGNFTGKTLYVPGPYRMAPGLPGEDSPPDPTGVYNGQATYTGCAVDAQHNVFANDIGTAQGAFPIPTSGRLIEWFAPSYTTSCVLYGPTSRWSWAVTTTTAPAGWPSQG